MKKIFVFISVVFVFSMGVQAQSWKNVLGQVANKVSEEVAATEGADGVLANVLGDLIGNSVPFSKSLIEGTWNYEGMACVLESEDALSDMGGTAVTSKVEETLDGYLAKVGVKEGVCSFTFMANDSCCLTVNGRDLKGTYELNAEEKTVNFSFLRNKLNMKSYISYNVKDINVVFETDKLLSLIKNVSSTVSDKKSSLGSLSSSSSKLGTATTALSAMSGLLDNYDGMMLGMRLKK